MATTTSPQDLKARMKLLKLPSSEDATSTANSGKKLGSATGVASFGGAGGGSSSGGSPVGSMSSSTGRGSRPRPSLGLQLDSPFGGLTSPVARRSASAASSAVPGLSGLGNLSAPPSRAGLRFDRFPTQPPTQDENERKLNEIMQLTGVLTIDGIRYPTPITDLEPLGDLGNGTCGHVVKMRHKESGKIIACKQMRRTGNSEETKRIVMDMDVVLKSHDCKEIVVCLGCYITASDVWICMELMATCFDKLLKHLKAPIPENICGKVAVRTLNALNYLKETHGVIHRDVKPSNILLDYEGKVKLCDFGISGRLVDSKAKTRSAGCAAYMAPERINPPNPSKPDYDIRADVWSLGITLVELATGQFPYKDCKTEFEVLTKVIQDDPPCLPQNKGFSIEFRQFVHDCLLKNHKDRPKYKKLLEHPFIVKYRDMEVDVGAWYSRVAKHSGDPNKKTPGSSGSEASHNYASSNIYGGAGASSRKTSFDQQRSTGDASSSTQSFKPQPSPRMVKSWRIHQAAQQQQQHDDTGAASTSSSLSNPPPSCSTTFSRLKFYTTNANNDLHHQDSGQGQYLGFSSPEAAHRSPRGSEDFGKQSSGSGLTSPTSRYNDGSSSSSSRLQDFKLYEPGGSGGGRLGSSGAVSPRYFDFSAQRQPVGYSSVGGSGSGGDTTGQASSASLNYISNGSLSRNNFAHASYHGSTAERYLSRPTYINSRSQDEYQHSSPHYYPQATHHHHQLSSPIKSPQAAAKRYDSKFLGSSRYSSEGGSPSHHAVPPHRKYSFETLDAHKEYTYTPKGTRKYEPYSGSGVSAEPSLSPRLSESGAIKLDSSRAGLRSQDHQQASSHHHQDLSDSDSSGVLRGRQFEGGGATSVPPTRKYHGLPLPDSAGNSGGASGRQSRDPGRIPPTMDAGGSASSTAGGSGSRNAGSSSSSSFLPSLKFSSWTLSSPLSFRRFRTSTSTDRTADFDRNRRHQPAYRSLNERDKQFYSASGGKSDKL